MDHEQPPQERPGEQPDVPEQESTPEAEPRIWVGSWLDYNNGVLHGDWLAADQEPAELRRSIDAVLAGSPTAARTGEVAEEWGIFDVDGFGGLRIGESEDLDIVSQVAHGIREHGLAFAAWAEVMDAEPDALAGFRDAYLGHYESAEAYAEQLIEELGYDQLLQDVVPEQLRPYVRLDPAALAQDMWLGGEIYVTAAAGGGVWIFDSR